MEVVGGRAGGVLLKLVRKDERREAGGKGGNCGKKASNLNGAGGQSNRYSTRRLCDALRTPYLPTTTAPRSHY